MQGYHFICNSTRCRCVDIHTAYQLLTPWRDGGRFKLIVVQDFLFRISVILVHTVLWYRCAHPDPASTNLWQNWPVNLSRMISRLLQRSTRRPGCIVSTWQNAYLRQQRAPARVVYHGVLCLGASRFHLAWPCMQGHAYCTLQTGNSETSLPCNRQGKTASGLVASPGLGRSAWWPIPYHGARLLVTQAPRHQSSRASLFPDY
jgi:hypothetical protein